MREHMRIKSGAAVGTHRGDARVVCKHEPTDAMICSYVWRAARQRNLDGRWPPRDEVGELALADAQERLVYLYHTSTSGLSRRCARRTSVGSTSP